MTTDLRTHLPMHIAMLVSMADAQKADVFIFRTYFYPNNELYVQLKDVRCLDLMDALLAAGFTTTSDDPGVFIAKVPTE